MRTYDDGSHIDYTYSADGLRLRADYYLNPYTPAVPDGEFAIACDSSLLVHTWREYAGNRVYEDGVLSRLLFDGGYVSFRDSVPTYHYYIRDYLDKQEEKIVTLPEVIVVAPACPSGLGKRNSYRVAVGAYPYTMGKHHSTIGYIPSTKVNQLPPKYV